MSRPLSLMVLMTLSSETRCLSSPRMAMRWASIALTEPIALRSMHGIWTRPSIKQPANNRDTQTTVRRKSRAGSRLAAGKGLVTGEGVERTESGGTEARILGLSARSRIFGHPQPRRAWHPTVGRRVQAVCLGTSNWALPRPLSQSKQPDQTTGNSNNRQQQPGHAQFGSCKTKEPSRQSARCRQGAGDGRG